ncbi:MAG: hypothetical protein HYT87_10925 [Nitrospirae bacterium]|nr:hypothetical protein [Nitrospirota bacterium]
MKEEGKKGAPERVSDQILGAVDKIIPGFHGFFKKAEKSGTFGPRIKEIRKKIERRFGRVKT